MSVYDELNSTSRAARLVHAIVVFPTAHLRPCPWRYGQGSGTGGLTMKRIFVIGVTLFAAHAALFAQDPASRQNPDSVSEARHIMDASIAAAQRCWQTRLQYSYVERDASRRRDADGRVRSEDVAISRTILVNGIPFEQLVERNGHPPSSWEAWRQAEAIEKLKQETSEERVKRLREQTELMTSLVEEVPKAFDVDLVGQEVIHGRMAYVIQATPHPGYEPRGKYGRFFSKVEGRLWIDTQDLGWMKVEAQVIKPLSIGLFVVRLLRGSHITMEQTRVDDGTWMPLRVEVRADAKLFLVKSLAIDRVLTYSEYRKETLTSRSLTASLPTPR